LVSFLDLYCPYSRKTLGAISTMLTKKWLNEFTITDELKPKRLEESQRSQIMKVLKK
jgi:hypothetical protein